MGKKAMKTPGAPGAKHSPIAPLPSDKPGYGMPVDDASAKDVYAGGLRPRHLTADGDSALGLNRHRSRTATTASAQFRITASRTPFSQPEYPGTLAAGRVLPSVMGSRQNFYAAGRYGPLG